jgi:hypothetical protein
LTVDTLYELLVQVLELQLNQLKSAFGIDVNQATEISLDLSSECIFLASGLRISNSLLGSEKAEDVHDPVEHFVDGLLTILVFLHFHAVNQQL